MAQYSYNGWLASPNPSDFGGLVPLVVAGETFAPGVRAGDVFTIFQYLANQLHARVEPVYQPGWHEQDDWGYSFRQNRNANNLSCHSSGTAIDYNATRHPNGRTGSFNAAQIATIRQIINVELEGVVDWGGDWGPGSTPDWMHFEISGSVADVARVAAKLRGGVTPSAPPPGLQYEERVNAPLGTRVLELGKVGDDVAFVQRWHGIDDDGYFGPATEAKVKATQERNGLVADGVVGPKTWSVMGIGAAPAAPPAPAPAPPPPPPAPSGSSFRAEYGQRGDHVTRLQRFMTTQFSAYNKYTPTGFYGDSTAAGIRTFAHRVGITSADGRNVGPQIAAALAKYGFQG